MRSSGQSVIAAEFMPKAGKDYQARLKTPQMYKELKRQSQKIPQKITLESLKIENKEPSRASKRLENKHSSSVSSKIFNKSQKKQNKCSNRTPIIKKRDYNIMKGNDCSQTESEQCVILQNPTKKRKSSKPSMSVIYPQPKQETPKKTLNYCESERISNRISSSISIKTRSQSQKSSMKKTNQGSLNKVQIKLESTQTIKNESSKQKKKQIVKKQSSKTKIKKPEKIKIIKFESEGEQKQQPLKESKYQLLLSRLLFDHSKNKFPILSRKSSSKALYAKKTKGYFNYQKNIEVKSLNELLKFVKRLHEQQMSNKNGEAIFTLSEKTIKKQRDPYVLTYSQLSQRDSIQQICLQDERDKFKPQKHLSNTMRSEQWSIQGFLLQSICSLIGSWNIIRLQSRNSLLPGFTNKNGSTRLQSSSASKRGKSKSDKKNNTFPAKHLRCHQYCYSQRSQEKTLLTLLLELIKMYFTYQSYSCQNVHQSFNRNTEIDQSLSRMKRRNRLLQTYHKIIRIQVEQTLKIISPSSIQPHKILKKEQKVEQYSLSTEEQILTSQEHNSKLGSKKKANRQKDAICWLNCLRKQLKELLVLMQKTQSNLTSQISRLEKQQKQAFYYFGKILTNHSASNKDKLLSHKFQQKMAFKAPNDNNINIFAESLQLPKQTCFDHCSLPYESCFEQIIPDQKEKEFQEFLKRVLNVESLEGVYKDNINRDITFISSSPQSCQNMIPSDQSLIRSEVSFSEMDTLKSQILNAFDQLQNELLHKQKDQISY